MKKPRVTVLVSVDMEEDNWRPSWEGVSVDNVEQVPRLARFLAGLGVRPTYFTTFQVAIRRRAIELLRGATLDGRGDLGAHLHPWNTPPTESSAPSSTMLLDYPYGQQLAKVRRLTHELGAAFGVVPTTFRAGRFALGSSTVKVLLDCGYEADSSVTPYFSWSEWNDSKDGPNFVGAPTSVYMLGPESDPRLPDPTGHLLEVPISAGFTRFSTRRWGACDRVLGSPIVQRLGLAGLAARTEFVRRLILSPETYTCKQMLALSRRLIASGVPYLHLFFHSSSLTPGLTPFSRTSRDVDRLYRRVETYIEALDREAVLSFATIGETTVRERSARGLRQAPSRGRDARARSP